MGLPKSPFSIGSMSLEKLMSPEFILTATVLVLAFIGYVWCLSRGLWLTIALSAALAFQMSRSMPMNAGTLTYWGAAFGVFVTALVVKSLLPVRSAPSIGSADPEPSRKGQQEIVIDGTNVMYWDGEADLRTLRSVVDTLRARKLAPYVFLDASSRHHLGDTSLDKKGFASALGLPRNRVMVCPAKTEADAFILKFAQERQLPVVSNDRFGDRAAQAKGLKLIKGVIAGGKPVLHGF
ncbi:RNase Zc3h12a domain containing protein [Sulfitobacter noctilucae]|uniref:NYN domain-containing protein n=1 Tax=Sulfitobacter noctilucae TaxID=1342302 RepID=UPI000468FD38|nr:hypothetical protein [Sulfitobacter noctilucae]KIN75395.1 RNase Zc3h12a domain containing protein [Sulfitobacter noctilucae]